ncbi:hypothetical protein ACFPRL_28120 [Pseudoclavibacter helvolus]
MWSSEGVPVLRGLLVSGQADHGRRLRCSAGEGCGSAQRGPAGWDAFFAAVRASWCR